MGPHWHIKPQPTPFILKAFNLSVHQRGKKQTISCEALLLCCEDRNDAGRRTYRFHHGFSLVIAHRNIMHLVLVTEVTHHLIGGVEHLA